MQGPAAAVTERCPRTWRVGCTCLLASVSALAPSVALAQVSAEVALASNAIFRGESISDDDPALTAEVGIDHASGLFAGASASISAGKHDPRIVVSSQYAGFSLRSGEASIEVGAVHRHYPVKAVIDEAYRNDYFEGFVGVSRQNVRVRFYLSPDYLKDGRNTYYGELNARLVKLGEWSLSGHAGAWAIPPDPGDTGTRFYYDWSLRANRSAGRFQLAVGIAGSNYPVFSESKGEGFFSNSPRVFASVSRAF